MKNDEFRSMKPVGRMAKIAFLGIPTFLLIIGLLYVGRYVPQRRVVTDTPEDVEVSQFDVALENPGFEAEFYEQNGIGELTIGEGWQAWYIEGQGHHRPEYKPELLTVGSGRVYEGAKAQKQFTLFSKQDGGLFQRLEGFKPGKWYEFSAWIYVWVSGLDDPDRSDGAGYSALVGMNPWGDCWPTYRATIWGEETLTYDQWVRISVTAQAWSENLCFFTRGTQKWPVKHNDSYWDAISLHEVAGPGGDGCPTPEPCPTVQAGAVDYDRISDVIRAELKRLKLTIE